MHSIVLLLLSLLVTVSKGEIPRTDQVLTGDHGSPSIVDIDAVPMGGIGTLLESFAQSGFLANIAGIVQRFADAQSRSRATYTLEDAPVLKPSFSHDHRAAHIERRADQPIPRHHASRPLARGTPQMSTAVGPKMDEFKPVLFGESGVLTQVFNLVNERRKVEMARKERKLSDDSPAASSNLNLAQIFDELFQSPGTGGSRGAVKSTGGLPELLGICNRLSCADIYKAIEEFRRSELFSNFQIALQMLSDPKGWDMIGELLARPELIEQFAGGSGSELSAIFGPLLGSGFAKSAGSGRATAARSSGLDLLPEEAANLGTDFSALATGGELEKVTKPDESMPEISFNVDRGGGGEEDYYHEVVNKEDGDLVETTTAASTGNSTVALTSTLSTTTTSIPSTTTATATTATATTATATTATTTTPSITRIPTTTVAVVEKKITSLPDFLFNQDTDVVDYEEAVRQVESNIDSVVRVTKVDERPPPSGPRSANKNASLSISTTIATPTTTTATAASTSIAHRLVDVQHTTRMLNTAQRISQRPVTIQPSLSRFVAHKSPQSPTLRRSIIETLPPTTRSTTTSTTTTTTTTTTAPRRPGPRVMATGGAAASVSHRKNDDYYAMYDDG